jgi:hypothetical protein
LEFLETCRGYLPSTVGVWSGKPIVYELLNATEPVSISDEQMEKLGWTNIVKPEESRRQHVLLEGQIRQANHQRLGYVGRLTFDDQYVEEKSRLEAQWLALSDWPALPFLARTADLQPIPVLPPDSSLNEPALPSNSADFLRDFGRFLRKWQLSQMLTWDLPIPHGPLELIPSGLARTILGPDQPVSFLPTYFDQPSRTASDGMDQREKTRDDQRRLAKADGIQLEHPVTDVSARDGHPSSYETAFRMWLIETSIRNRYGNVYGLAARLVRAFVDLFEISEDWARDLRKTYRARL